MSADEERTAGPATPEDVKLAYDTYCTKKAAYLEVLARYVQSHPEESDPLFSAFADEAPLLRVLHALSVGYGWTDALYKVSTRSEVAQAQLRGFVARDKLHDGLVLTLKGTQMLQRWTEYVLPLKDEHARYGSLWQSVTGLDG
jgi:hypothetical protein